MAENAIIAFGRYLRALRERRGCSLDEVASLSQTFPEKINKGYLSRCENGRQKLAFSKVIALSRIYEVPADVLVERMELDLELDRVGGPETEGMSFAELTEAGKKALRSGHFWNAYGYFRDAVVLAPSAPLKPRFRTADEQQAAAIVNSGSAIRALACHRLALHEFLHIESSNTFDSRLHPVLLERISRCYAALREKALAQEYADRAIAEANSIGDDPYLGYLYAARAGIAADYEEYTLAASLYEKAHAAHKSAGDLGESTHALNCLARCYLRLNRVSAARRVSEACEKLAKSSSKHRSRAFSLLTQGEIDDAEGRPQSAIRRWRAALDISKQLNDKQLRFKTELLLYQRALTDGDAPVARAIQRRLTRLSPWIQPDTEELLTFKRLSVSSSS